MCSSAEMVGKLEGNTSVHIFWTFTIPILGLLDCRPWHLKFSTMWQGYFL